MNELLSKDFLESIGVSLDGPTYQSLAQHYEDTLNNRVISEIVDELDEPQLAELEQLKAGAAETLQQWLIMNVPQLSEIIEDEVAILLGEIAEKSDEIVE